MMLQKLRCLVLWTTIRISCTARFEAWEGDLNVDGNGSEIAALGSETEEADSGLLRARGVHESGEIEHSNLARVLSFFSLPPVAAEMDSAISGNQSVDKRILYNAGAANTSHAAEENQTRGEHRAAGMQKETHGLAQLELFTQFKKRRISLQSDFTLLIVFAIIGTLVGCVVLTFTAYLSFTPSSASDNGIAVGVQGTGGNSGGGPASGGLEKSEKSIDAEEVSEGKASQISKDTAGEGTGGKGGSSREPKQADEETKSGTKAGEKRGGIEGGPASNPKKDAKNSSRRASGRLRTGEVEKVREEWSEQYMAIQKALSSRPSRGHRSLASEDGEEERSQSLPVGSWRLKKTTASDAPRRGAEEDGDESGPEKSWGVIRFKSVPEKREYYPDSDNPP